jgi:adenosylmethionine-8-amino-7-oxononanoate aminotransferase
MDTQLRETPLLHAPALWSAQAHLPTVIGRQLVITHGQDSHVVTSDGRSLYDATAGLWHANVGHGRAELAEVASAQMRKLETYHVFGRFVNDRALELAERLADLSPIRDPKVILNSGGSDAIDVACKLARRHWQLHGQPGKRTILSREFGYHGLHAYGTSIAGLDANREGYGTDSLVPETARVSVDDLTAVERTIDRIGPSNIAALVCEPVQGTGGVNPPADGYLEGLNRLCQDNDILLIADEVITGFGRTGRMFATERYGMRPDLVTFAKGVTSGYAPLGGVLVAPRVWEAFYADDPATPVFRHGATYAGHATASAVALRNLDILEEENLLPRVEELEVLLGRQLGRIGSHPLVAETRHSGLLGGISLVPEVSAEFVTDDLLEAGMISRPLRGNTLQISPPFVTTDDELTSFFSAVRTVLDDRAATS